MSKTINKREFIRGSSTFVAATGLSKWIVPTLSSIALPAHAQASCCLDIECSFGSRGCRTFEGVAAISIELVNNTNLTVTIESARLRTPSNLLFESFETPYKVSPVSDTGFSVWGRLDSGYSCVIAQVSTIEVLASAEGVPAQWITFPQ